MVDNYKIEKIGYEGIDKITHLYTLCFNRKTDASFLKWKYFDNPAGEALCLAAHYDGNIVGSCVMLPEEFYVFGKRLKIYKCCDLMVLPQHRKQGISTKLIVSLLEYLKQSGPLFLYTLCGKNATGSFLRNQWLYLGNVDYYFKHRSQLRVKFLFNNFKKLYSKGILRKINSSSDLCKVYKFNPDVTKIHNVKDERYLGWRLSNPYYEYDITAYYEKDAAKGYVIYNKGIDNNAYIIDLEAHGNNPKIIKTLLSAVELSAYKSGRRLIIVPAVKGTIFQDFIKKNNYLNNPFRKGPLVSIIDFNILIDDRYGKQVFDKTIWDVRPLNYDDI